MKRFVDIVIVGGGVIGCAVAYYLSKQGRTVAVIEREDIGSQASSAAAGLLAPLGPLSGPGPFANLLLAGFAGWPSTAAELEEASGLRLGYEQTGALRVVRNPKRIARLRKRFDSWQPLGLKMHWLDGDEARRIEPHLTPEVSAAIYAPEESQIHAQQVVQAFARAAQRLGATFYTHAEASAIDHSHNRVTAVRIAQSAPIACEYLILATGAWAAYAGEWLHLHLPVSPLRGQMLALQQPPSALRTIVFGDAAYLLPRGKHVLVGATKEESAFDLRVTSEGQNWLRSTATRLAPSLQRQRTIAAWAGLRPHTPDAHPILGLAPGWDNVFLTIGHASVGVLLSAITGKVIAELIATGKTPELIRPFALERFTSTQNKEESQQ